LSDYHVNDFIVVVPLFLLCCWNWVFFIRNNFLSAKVKAGHTDKLKRVQIVKKMNVKVLFRWGLTVNFALINWAFLLKGFKYVFWKNHLYLSNFNCNLLCFVIFVSSLMLYVAKNVNNVNLNLSVDYGFSIVSINLFMLVVFLANSLYTLFFFIEVVSILMFYKFITSRFWFKPKNANKKLDAQVPGSFVNVMFFQYWANFFSSIVMLFSIVTITYTYGSTEWFFLNSIIRGQDSLSDRLNQPRLFFIWLPFLLSFCIKIGLAPMHLFKVEIYKGLSFFSLFFYTVYYLTTYLLLLGVLIIVYLKSMSVYWFFLLTFIVIIGLFFTISFLFNLNLTKSFFAYSTIVNTLSFFCILIGVC